MKSWDDPDSDPVGDVLKAYVSDVTPEPEVRDCLRCGPVVVSYDFSEKCTTDIGWAVVTWGRHIARPLSPDAKPGDLDFFHGVRQEQMAEEQEAA